MGSRAQKTAESCSVGRNVVFNISLHGPGQYPRGEEKRGTEEAQGRLTDIQKEPEEEELGGQEDSQRERCLTAGTVSGRGVAGSVAVLNV